MNTPSTHTLQKLEPNSQYIKDFLTAIKNVPELKFMPWLIQMQVLKHTLRQNGSDVYGVINKNKELVGGILLSDESKPRNSKKSKKDPNRKATFDELHGEGYKYGSYGFLKESERGKTNLKELLKQIDQKFYTTSPRKGAQKLLKNQGGEEVIQPNGEKMPNLVFENTPYIKYDPDNNPYNQEENNAS